MNKRNERAKKKRELDTRSAVGRDNFLVKRHKADGEVSDKDSRNKFITVGSVRWVLRSALNGEYPGGLCESSLCSIRRGDSRFVVCDCGGKLSHKLPNVSGPRDKPRWDRIMRRSEEARKKLSETARERK